MDINRIQDIAKQTDAPFYLYDLDEISGQIGKVKRSFAEFNVIYSVKVNPCKVILKLMRELGAGIDAASKNEALSSAELGFTPSQIYYSAPGKTIGEIRAAIGKSTIIADSLNELELLDTAAGEKNIQANVGVRLNLPNPMMLASTHEVMGGGASKFGIDINTLNLNKNKLKNYKNINIKGIHVYFGSQISDIHIIQNNFKLISECALGLMSDFDLKFINFGGGFGIPYAETDEELDLCALSRLVMSVSSVKELLARKVVCNLELGRYLVGDGGVYVTKVVDIKESFGKKYVIVKGGMNAFFRPVFTKDFHGIIQFTDENEYEKVTVVGDMCTPIDQYYGGINLKKINTGDVVAFKKAGAYGYSMSLLDFISHDRPKQYYLKDGCVNEIN